MTKDDILLALRLTAMGRAGHPLQEQLADELARLLPEPVAMPESVIEPVIELQAQTIDVEVEVLRDKRRKKAD